MSIVMATMPRRETPRIPHAHAATAITHTSTPDSRVKLAMTNVTAAAASIHHPPRDCARFSAIRQKTTTSRK